MERAAVLIGVKKTGNLPELQAARSGAKAMAEWAQSQGIADSHIKVLTDEDSPVQIHQIKKAIKELVNRTTIEQLIVYFAGHGINNGGEYWLLSEAPADPDEAVNLEGSVKLARYCGIEHVVLISDACRTAADGIQALGVRGGDVFPNEPAGGLEKPVDVFFACARGKPSLEVRDPDEAAKNFSAVYTDVLVECLKGQHEDLLEYVKENDAQVGLVREWPLKRHLQDVVPRRLKKKLGRAPKINQTPDARINSEDAWLARIPIVGRKKVSRRETPVEPVSRGTLITPFSVSDTLVSVALDGELSRWQEVLDDVSTVGETSDLTDTVNTFTTPFGPTGFETDCGIKVRGAKVERVVGNGVTSKILDDEGSIVRLQPTSHRASSVLIVLRNGTGAVVPAIPDFIAALTFDGDELVDMSYEPSDNSRRWHDYVVRADERRALSATIAASVGLGVFRLKSDDPMKLARRMQVSKGVDPSMALYAAYAYHDLQRGDLINEMGAFQFNDLGFVFYDIALLSGKLAAQVKPGGDVVPQFPLLSQGWPLLSAFRANLPGSLSDLDRHLLPSLWTVFDKAGVVKLEAAIQSDEVR